MQLSTWKQHVGSLSVQHWNKNSLRWNCTNSAPWAQSDWSTGLVYRMGLLVYSGLLDWSTGLLDWSTVLLDWSTGLLYWSTGLLYWTALLVYWSAGLGYWTVLLVYTGLMYWSTGLVYWPLWVHQPPVEDPVAVLLPPSLEDAVLKVVKWVKPLHSNNLAVTHSIPSGYTRGGKGFMVGYGNAAGVAAPAYYLKSLAWTMAASTTVRATASSQMSLLFVNKRYSKKLKVTEAAKEKNRITTVNGHKMELSKFLIKSLWDVRSRCFCSSLSASSKLKAYY